MEYIAVLLPSISIGIIFWFILRWIFRGDRTERAVESRSQEDAERWYEELKQRDGEDLPFGHSPRRGRRTERRAPGPRRTVFRMNSNWRPVCPPFRAVEFRPVIVG